MSVDISSLSAAERSELLAQIQQAENKEKKIQEKRKEQYYDERDKAIEWYAKECEQFQKELIVFKKQASQRFSKLHQQQEEVFGATNTKGNKSMKTQDENYKVRIQYQEHQELNETAASGFKKIEEYMTSVVKKRDQLSYEMLKAIMQKKNGDFDAKDLLKLKKLEKDIKDELFSEGIRIIEEAFETCDTTQYIRAYRKKTDGHYDNITLNFSSLPVE